MTLKEDYETNQHFSYEAGADAMLKALRELTQDQEYLLELNGIWGHYLFIPEESK